MTTTLASDTATAIQPSSTAVLDANEPAIAPPQSTDTAAEIHQMGRDMLWVEPWDDPITDPLGHDPGSKYAELFWLPILGPSSLWLLRRVSLMLQDSPSGFSVKMCDLAQEIGLGNWRGPRSPFQRAVDRCCDFQLAVRREESFVYVRRRMPTLGRRLVHRLPQRLREMHENWGLATEKSPDANPLPRARNLALALLATGDTMESAEQTLLAWGLHPAIVPDAVDWANSRLASQEA